MNGRRALGLVDRVSSTRAKYAPRLRACEDLAGAKALQEELVSLDGSDRDTVLGNHLVQIFGKLGRTDQGIQAFERIVHRNIFSWNVLLGAVARNGDFQLARALFDRMPERSIVSWTTAIAAFLQSGDPAQALRSFLMMEADGVVPDRAAFLGVLDAVSSAQVLQEGISVHARIAHLGLDSDISIGSALVNMYGKCQDLHRAKIVFDFMARKNVVAWTAIVAAAIQSGHVLGAKILFEKMPRQDLVSWNSMISGLGKNGASREALDLFGSMAAKGMVPDKSTLLSAIDACANLPSLVEGREIHSRLSPAMRVDKEIHNALVNMYGSCGDLELARTVFDQIEEKDVVSWTTIIAAYAHHGHSRAALDLFHRMACDGQEPNEITLTTLLYACNYTGLINDGVYYFLCLHLEYGVLATVDHYVWLIDVLGRCGQLEKAEDLLRSMPFEPRPLAWRMLLGSCQSQKDVERAQRMGHYILATNSVRSSPYVVLANMFVSTSSLPGS